MTCVRRGDFRDHPLRSDAPDLVLGGHGKPEGAIWTGDDAGGRRKGIVRRQRELGYGAAEGDAPDLACASLSEPEIPVGADDNGGWITRCRRKRDKAELAADLLT